MIPCLEQLEDRLTPAPVLASPQVTLIEVGSTIPDLTALGQVLAGPYAADLGAWGVHSGNLLKVVRVGDPGPVGDVQIQQLLTSLIQSGSVPTPGPNSFYEFFLPHWLTDPWAAKVGGYHELGFKYNGQDVAYGVVWPTFPLFPISSWSFVASHEAAEGFVDPYGGNPEVADPLFPQSFKISGWVVALFILPDGQPFQPPPPPPATPAALIDLALAEAEYDIDKVLSLYSPSYSNKLQTDVLTIQANPWDGTFIGIAVEIWVDQQLGLQS